MIATIQIALHRRNLSLSENNALESIMITAFFQKENDVIFLSLSPP